MFVGIVIYIQRNIVKLNLTKGHILFFDKKNLLKINYFSLILIIFSHLLNRKIMKLQPDITKELQTSKIKKRHMLTRDSLDAVQVARLIPLSRI